MEEFYVLIWVAFFVMNSLDKAESVQLEELPLQTFDEICEEGWLDKAEAEDLQRPPTNFGQNVHHQIDRQNTQIGQIEPNSTDQNHPFTESDHAGQIEPNSTNQSPPHTKSDHSGQIEPNSTNQSPPHTKSDHSGQIEPNSTDQNIPLTKSDHSRQIEPNSTNQSPPHTKKVNRKKIYEWKNEFGLSRKMHNFRKGKNEQKNLVEKFDQRKAKLMRDGFKNSQNDLDKIVAKELGLSDTTIYNWKRKLGQTKPNKYTHSEQKELMSNYYEIKGKNPKISDEKITKMLKIGSRTLFRWKKQFKRQQSDPNSVDGQSLEENAGSNVQEIGNSNLG